MTPEQRIAVLEQELERVKIAFNTLAPDVHGGLNIGYDHSLPQLNKDRWAVITAYDGANFYGWQEVMPNDEGGTGSTGFANLDGGQFGTTAVNPIYEPNDFQIPIGSYVRYRRAYFDQVGTHDWVYVAVWFGSLAEIQGAATGSVTTASTFTVQPNVTGSAIITAVAVTPSSGTWSSNTAIGVTVGHTYQVTIGTAVYTFTVNTTTGGTYVLTGTTVPIGTLLTLTANAGGTGGTTSQVQPTYTQGVSGTGTFLLTTSAPLTTGLTGTYTASSPATGQQAYALTSGAITSTLTTNTLPQIPANGSASLVLATASGAILGVVTLTATGALVGTWTLYDSASLTTGTTGQVNYSWAPSDNSVTGSFLQIIDAGAVQALIGAGSQQLIMGPGTTSTFAGTVNLTGSIIVTGLPLTLTTTNINGQEGILLQNTTAATVGVQTQQPPWVDFNGTAWDGAASQTVQVRVKALTNQAVSPEPEYGSLIVTILSKLNGADLTNNPVTINAKDIADAGSGILIVGSPSNGTAIGMSLTRAKGITAANGQAAAAGAQQYGLIIMSEAQGWSTNAGGSSNAVDFGFYCKPTQGATATGTLTFVYRALVNGAAWSEVASISSTGAISDAGATHTITGIGTAVTAGDTLINTTAAALGAQQNSPALVLSGQAWAPTGGTSQEVDCAQLLIPVQGTSPPTGLLSWQFQINGGGYTQQMSLSSAGLLSTTQYLSTVNSIGSSAVSSGLQLKNTTAAVNTPSGAQVSPSLILTGNGFDGTDAQSEALDWAVQNIPTRGVAQHATSRLSFKRQRNAGGYTEVFSVAPDGAFEGFQFNANSQTGTGTVTGGIIYKRNLASGTAGAGFGAGYYTQLQDSGGTVQYAGVMLTSWISATAGAVKGRMDLGGTDTAAGSAGRIALSLGTDGTNPQISFLNATLVGVQTGDIGTALVTFGLMSGTPTFNAANLTGTVPAANLNVDLSPLPYQTGTSTLAANSYSQADDGILWMESGGILTLAAGAELDINPFDLFDYMPQVFSNPTATMLSVEPTNEVKVFEQPITLPSGAVLNIAQNAVLDLDPGREDQLLDSQSVRPGRDVYLAANQSRFLVGPLTLDSGRVWQLGTGAALQVM